MTTKLQMEPRRIWLRTKAKFSNISVIYKDIELKLDMAMETMTSW